MNEPNKKQGRGPWINAAVAALRKRHVPERMARTVIGLYVQYYPRNLSADLLAEDPESKALALWARKVRKSGFANEQELIAAWTAHGFWNRRALQRLEERELRQQNGGLLPEHIPMLLRPERVERTLKLMCQLSHWANARELLLYADREGLRAAKVRLVAAACEAGLLKPIARIPAQTEFKPFGDPEYREHIAWVAGAEVFDALRCRKGEKTLQAQRLYREFFGQEAPERRELRKGLEKKARKHIEEHIAACIEARLESLETEARETGRPIPVEALKALFVSPLLLPGFRWYLWPEWEDLYGIALEPLDPEQGNLVVCAYASPTACYRFHLPQRVAETVLGREAVAELPLASEGEREEGELLGQGPSREESLAQPIRTILAELGVSEKAICPDKLISKAEYIASLPPCDEWGDDGNAELYAYAEEPEYLD